MPCHGLSAHQLHLQRRRQRQQQREQQQQHCSRERQVPVKEGTTQPAAAAAAEKQQQQQQSSSRGRRAPVIEGGCHAAHQLSCTVQSARLWRKLFQGEAAASVTMLRGSANVTALYDMVGKMPAYEVWMAFAPHLCFACWGLQPAHAEGRVFCYTSLFCLLAF